MSRQQLREPLLEPVENQIIRERNQEFVELANGFFNLCHYFSLIYLL